MDESEWSALSHVPRNCLISQEVAFWLPYHERTIELSKNRGAENASIVMIFMSGCSYREGQAGSHDGCSFLVLQ
jgi:hypothetical protein